MILRSERLSFLLGLVFILLLCTSVQSVCGQTTQNAEEDSQVKLRVGYAHSEDAAQAELKALMSEVTDQQTWEARALKVREGILKGAKLTKLPNKTPLNPVFSSLRTYDGYTAENVAIESSPGFYVTGTVYRPTKHSGQLAGILSAHGHAGRFDPNRQKRCAVFAKMGAVVFHYDMMGYGDSKLAGWDHRKTPEVLRLQTWNSIRALDFLESMKDVDPKRLVYFGLSNGALRGPMALATDTRYQAAVLLSGGYTKWHKTIPEIQAFHFTPEVKQPVLMMNGTSDQVFPVETSQKPMFADLGSPQKKHLLFSAHHLINAHEVFNTMIKWLEDEAFQK